MHKSLSPPDWVPDLLNPPNQGQTSQPAAFSVLVTIVTRSRENKIINLIIRGAGLKAMALPKMPVVIFRLEKGPDDPYAVVGKAGGREADI